MSFRQKVEIMSNESISTADHSANYKTWVKDAADEFFAALASENSSMHSGLIVSPGDAEYNDLVDQLPPDPNRRAAILSNGSLYWRNDTNGRGVCSVAGYKTKTTCEANSGTWNVNKSYFCVNDGIFYKFVNVKQLNLAYHMFISRVSLKHLTLVQASDPDSKRAAKITKMTSDIDADTALCANDAAAGYTSNNMANPIRLEDAYQKVKVLS
tara:strand:+ start:816 stop:1451 length:636 start_codon:yes stop_codon:yes gene_type:complete